MSRLRSIIAGIEEAQRADLASVTVEGQTWVRRDWRPIESAPRDGTVVLLAAPGWDSPKTGWTYGRDDWQDCPYHHKGDPSYIPTHWMPLPALPAEGRAP